MKKLVLALSFVFVLGLVSVNAQVKKTTVKKDSVKTEQTTVKKECKKKEYIERVYRTKITTLNYRIILKKRRRKSVDFLLRF